MLILALPGAARLARGLARLLRCECSELAVRHFPDGETLVRIEAPLQGRRVVLAGSLDHPDRKTLPLLFAADTARELGATQVGLVAPYLGYMRQDARFHPGEAVTSRSYGRMLSASLDFLVTVDPHLHRWHSLDQIYSLRAVRVASAPRVARWVSRQVQRPLIVGPDAESQQWVSQVAQLAGAPWMVLEKTRYGDRDVSVAPREAGQWQDRTPVLLDDIASTGQTLVAAAGTLQRMGLQPRTAVAVHALFEDGAIERLRAAGIERIVSCDTVPHPTNAIGVTGLLAQALREL